MLVIFSLYLIIKTHGLFAKSTIATYLLYAYSILYILTELLYDNVRLKNIQIILSALIVIFPTISFLYNDSNNFIMLIRYTMPIFINFCILYPAKKTNNIYEYVAECSCSLIILFLTSTSICVISIIQYILILLFIGAS